MTESEKIEALEGKLFALHLAFMIALPKEGIGTEEVRLIKRAQESVKKRESLSEEFKVGFTQISDEIIEWSA